MNSADGWWCVYLPAWGKAWVEQAQACVTRVSLVDTPVRSTVHPVSFLELHSFPPGGDASVVDLIRLVGSGVTTLRLIDHDHEIDSHCEAIFDACPRLEVLDLDEPRPGRLATIPESFLAGRCRYLKFLKLRIRSMTEAALQAVTQIQVGLTDTTDSVTPQLEELEVTSFCVANGEGPLESTVLDVALHMLQRNTTLTGLKLDEHVAYDTATVERLSTAFAHHHNELLSAPLSQLGGREKAAFLSAVWDPARPHASATHRLDAQILSRIFAFAPERRRRRIDVMLSRRLVAADYY